MKSILIYFNSLQPAGGTERVITTLAEKLSGTFNITILVKDEPKSFYNIPDDVRFCTLNNGLVLNMKSRISRIFSISLSLIKNIRLLRHFLHNNHFDYYYIAHPMNALEFELARGIRKDTIITEHGSEAGYNSFYRYLKRKLYPKSKIYIVPTVSETKLYKDFGLPAYYIPHFKTDLKYEKSFLESKCVLTIGRFTDVKNHLSLLEIWLQLYKRKLTNNWKLRIVGKGELEPEYKKFLSKHDLESTVEIVSPTKAIEEYYKRASIFVLTSKSEGFGMVLLEAVGFGLPCISFDCPSGPRDIIDDGVNGYLIEDGNRIDFEQKLSMLINNADMLSAMSDNAISSSKNWANVRVFDRWLQVLN